ncbi:MFS transporter [Olivibacter domesticus]|uniref:Drug resistance transporter, Bcr/CflA subfamily n=1 Tax=Olivibacter domesticus TaxID=407022 RepID=A0A1H7QV40_OLID1|nr:MFS transporter [Olivibacter domesticus]SEL51783.1 drug resistance transporter, Bcr/CflA subfamily [Olivibacter domesticus]
MATKTLPVKTIKQQNLGISTILAFALIPLSGFATDIYIPSLPNMAVSLGVDDVKVQLTLSLFLISYGISQLFIGSVLDSFGRYRICLVSLFVFALSSIVIATTHNIYVIYAMRIIHGLTVGAIVVSKRAFFVDIYKGEKLKHYLSLFTIIWSAGPIIAPFIGGHFQDHFGWESNFYFLAAFALIIAALEIFFSGESLQYAIDFRIRSIVKIYVSMIRTASFSLGILMLGFAYCMVMMYNMTGPFIVEHHFNLSPVVAGYTSLFLGLAWMVGGFTGKATINKPFVGKMVMNLRLQLLAAIAMLFVLMAVDNLYVLIFFAFLIHIGAGYTYNNYFTYCLGKFPANAGIAGGLTGGVTYVIVSFLSYGIIYLFPAKDGVNLSYSYLLLIILSILVMYFVVRLNRKDKEQSFSKQQTV